MASGERGTVLLTGTSGFIAKHIALRLLQDGYTVRGSLRSMNRAAEVLDAVRPHLSDPQGLEDRLTFTELDMLSDAGWQKALEGVDTLLHTASPFPLVAPKDENDLIRPAVDGTLRALKAARAAGVRRVVLTSSVASVTEGFRPDPDAVYDENSWSLPDSPTIDPYSKSKTLAEKAAWRFVEDEAPDMQLTVVNPGMVVGPPLDRHFGSSISLLQRVIASKDPAIPNIGFTFVDVRDIAAMHVRAIDTPASIGGRFIGAGGWLWLPEVARIVARAFPERKVVTRRAPDALVRFLGLFDRQIRAAVPMLGRRASLSNARARDILGIDFIPPEDAIVAGAKYLIENRLV